MTDPRDPKIEDAAPPSWAGPSPQTSAQTPASTGLSSIGARDSTGARDTAELLASSEAGEQQRFSKVHLNHLTLHEERARIDVVREVYGSVTINKVVTERQELVPVMLRTEKLEITIASGGGEVMIDGVALEPGRTHEVLLLEERATIQKEVFPSLDVQIWKESRVVDQSETVSLRREVLEVIDPMGLAHESSQIETSMPDDQRRP